MSIRAATIGFAMLTGTVIAPAFAEPISDAYDGLYEGSSDVIKPLSGEKCRSLGRHSMKITDGGILGSTPKNDTSFEGIVTSDGFLTSQYAFSGERGKGRLEGKIDSNGKFVGGLTSPHERCSWTVTMSKTE